ncbi:MAG: hypothetical protein OEM07_02525 [Gammaproteobacteria bacterium]|nr:hypothetical protein [Gammaproteobacteria bacterium]
MINFQDKFMVSALIISALVVTLNALAVTMGAADGFYGEIQTWISSSL